MVKQNNISYHEVNQSIILNYKVTQNIILNYKVTRRNHSYHKIEQNKLMSYLRSTVKASYKWAGDLSDQEMLAVTSHKITTWEDLEKERISNSKSYKGVELNTSLFVLTIKCIFIARKIRHGKFLANI